MRWALRKKDKIREHFYPYGDQMLERIRQSINDAFEADDDAGAKAETIEGEPYPLLTIPDAGNTSGCIKLYVIKRQYDVYTLAFKEFITNN